MKKTILNLLLLTFVTTIFSQEAMYVGDLSFDYSGTLNGSYQSGITLDSLDIIPENGTFGTMYHDGTNMHTIVSAMTPSNTDDTRFDIFFLHLSTEDTPEPGNFEISGLDLDGFEEIPTTMLFILEADTTFIYSLFESFTDGISDSLETNEIIISMMMEFIQYAYIPLSGNIEITSLTSTEFTGGFNGNFMKLGFPPQFIEIENGDFNLVGTDFDFLPQPPENLNGVYNSQSITLSWDSVQDSLVSGYNIYRSIENDSLMWIGQTDFMTTSYTDNSIDIGQTYYYAVTTYYFDYIESSYSELIMVETENLMLGDVNGDSLINVVDIITIVNFILGNDEPTDTEFYLSDFNSDEFINVVDIIAIVNVILGN
jgi:hypothetical protein